MERPRPNKRESRWSGIQCPNIIDFLIEINADARDYVLEIGGGSRQLPVTLNEESHTTGIQSCVNQFIRAI